MQRPPGTLSVLGGDGEYWPPHVLSGQARAGLAEVVEPSESAGAHVVGALCGGPAPVPSARGVAAALGVPTRVIGQPVSEEPCAGNPHARIRGGTGRQRPVLPDRHFLAVGPVAGLAGRVPKPAGAALLIPTPGPPQRDPARVARARPRAVALPAVAAAAQEEELLAIRPNTDDQSQRIHALPRSGRGSWTSTLRCAKKGAATRALPRV